MGSQVTELDDTQQRLAFGTTSHYRDAEHYDQTYRRRTHDVQFYVEQCQGAANVLELGAGTGRIALKLAQSSVEVTGVELVPQMLARAKERTAKCSTKVQKRIQWMQGDARKFRLEKRFSRVIAPFNMFMHLYSRSDIELALETVRLHLAPDGRFIFDVLMPDTKYLSRPADRIYKGRTIKKQGKPYAYRETFSYDPVTQVQTVGIYHQSMTDPEDIHYESIAHRYLFPEELLALLHHNGFSVQHRYGDFDETPLDIDSESQIIVAALATS